MVDSPTSWLEIVELPTVFKLIVPNTAEGKKVTCNSYTKESDTTFDKSSAKISNLVRRIWFSRHPRCQYIIYINESKFKLHFCATCDTYGIKRKPTSLKSPQANAILEHIYAIVMNMLCTAKLDMGNSLKPSDIGIFLSDAAWAICSTHHIVLKASPGEAIFG